MLINAGQTFERPKLGEVRYVGEVEDNNDPEGMGRCKIRVLDVFGSKIDTRSLPWAAPTTDVGEGAGEQLGSFSVPLVGSTVLVYFHKGDIYSPIYEAQLRAKTQLIDEMQTNYPLRYGFKDSLGNHWFVDKTESDDRIEFHHHSGTSITIDNEGSIVRQVAKDETVNITGNSTVVVNKASSVTIKENSEVLVKGDLTTTVEGNLSATVEGDATSQVSGELSATIDGDANLTVNGNCTARTGSINASVSGSIDLTTTSSAKITVNGGCQLSVSGALKITASSSFQIVSSAACSINASAVTLQTTRLELGAGASEPLVLGNKLAQFLVAELTPWLNTHVHTSSAPGAQTSPPILPFQSGSMTPGGPLYSNRTLTQT